MTDHYPVAKPAQNSTQPDKQSFPAPTVDSNRTHKVIFQPSGRSGNVREGTTLLEAARQLGVGIEAICGGNETCNK